MGRRRELNDVGIGILQSFLSRNNDVYGYWGIGKIYLHMIKTETMKVEIDLIKKTIIPFNNELLLMVNIYSKKLQTHLESRRIKKECLPFARIKIHGYPNEIIPKFGKMAPNRVNCIIELVDDRNKEYCSKGNTWCRPHDPRKESKSTRKYNNETYL